MRSSCEPSSVSQNLKPLDAHLSKRTVASDASICHRRFRSVGAAATEKRNAWESWDDSAQDFGEVAGSADIAEGEQSAESGAAQSHTEETESGDAVTADDEDFDWRAELKTLENRRREQVSCSRSTCYVPENLVDSPLIPYISAHSIHLSSQRQRMRISQYTLCLATSEQSEDLMASSRSCALFRECKVLLFRTRQAQAKAQLSGKMLLKQRIGLKRHF